MMEGSTDIIIIVAIFVFSYLIWTLGSVSIQIKKQRYIALYDLWKLNEELKKRKLSFEELDLFEPQIQRQVQSGLETIDKNYQDEQDEMRKGHKE